ncbi:MAG: 2-oxo acid dehydrogenase subunit E2 [Myxococcales bacterium FL481]|nr:MAG: 2-oxo acid dehydrogenase subunit E2 [Myxococcales bacterium FL481]
MFEFKLPEIGEGVVEGEIVRWLKQPGEFVTANDGLLEVMTDKATVEIPSPIAGTVHELTAAEGDICPVGEVIARLDPSAAAPAEPTAATKPANAAVTAPQGAAEPTATSERVLATPAARALARERGVDLSTVAPDAHGRVTKHLVLAADRAAPVASSSTVAPMAGPTTTPAPAVATPAPATPPRTRRRADAGGGDTESLPFRGMRRRISESLSQTWSAAVHFTYVDELQVDRLVQLREDAKVAAAEQGVKLSYLPFIIKAVVHSLRKYPIVNAELDEANGRIIVHKRYHIGIATATEAGLAVPVIRDADQLSLLDLAREIERLGTAARDGKATKDDLTGSTFTITSLGTIGGLHATPILNQREVGILGVHAIRKVPVFDKQDQIVPGQRMNLSSSFDHRIVDGFEGASFVQEVKRYLEDPTLLFLAGI